MNKKAVTRFDKEVAHSVRDLVTRLNRRFRKQISNPDQLSVAELNVIQLLLDQALLPSELCAQLGLSSQYASQVLIKLVDMEYITRKTSTTDRRKSYAVITEKGRKRLTDTREEREEWLATAIAQLYSASDKALIQRAVELLGMLPDQ